MLAASVSWFPGCGWYWETKPFWKPCTSPGVMQWKQVRITFLIVAARKGVAMTGSVFIGRFRLFFIPVCTNTVYVINWRRKRCFVKNNVFWPTGEEFWILVFEVYRAGLGPLPLQSWIVLVCKPLFLISFWFVPHYVVFILVFLLI